MSLEYSNFKIVKIIKYLIDSCDFYTLSIVTCYIWCVRVQRVKNTRIYQIFNNFNNFEILIFNTH
jgi:hypothetical protein